MTATWLLHIPCAIGSCSGLHIALHTYKEKDFKIVCYLSAEFLMGPHLGNNLINLGIYNEVRDALNAAGLDLEVFFEQEIEPGLGNGGLGRLAACYLDSLASLQIPAIGYGIRYDSESLNRS